MSIGEFNLVKGRSRKLVAAVKFDLASVDVLIPAPKSQTLCFDRQRHIFIY